MYPKYISYFLICPIKKIQTRSGALLRQTFNTFFRQWHRRLRSWGVLWNVNGKASLWTNRVTCLQSCSYIIYLLWLRDMRQKDAYHPQFLIFPMEFRNRDRDLHWHIRSILYHRKQLWSLFCYGEASGFL